MKKRHKKVHQSKTVDTNAKRQTGLFHEKVVSTALLYSVIVGSTQRSLHDKNSACPVLRTANAIQHQQHY